jgi:hypothetical protein
MFTLSLSFHDTAAVLALAISDQGVESKSPCMSKRKQALARFRHRLQRSVPPRVAPLLPCSQFARN